MLAIVALVVSGRAQALEETPVGRLLEVRAGKHRFDERRQLDAEVAVDAMAVQSLETANRPAARGESAMVGGHEVADVVGQVEEVDGMVGRPRADGGRATVMRLRFRPALSLKDTCARGAV